MPVLVPAPDSLLGRLIRLPFRAIPPDTVVPIVSGPRRGLKWIVGASNHSSWLGLYERDQTRNLCRYLHPGDVFFDIGTQAGYHTVLASRLVGHSGTVCSWEPLPRNLAFLHRHVELNALVNVRIFDSAVSDQDGSVCFDPGGGYMAGHIGPQGPLTVKAVQLDTLFYRHAIPAPSLIKIDVEGAELRVLEGADALLRQIQPVILLDTHDFLGGVHSGLHARCCRYLAALGYRCSWDPGPHPFAIDVLAVPASLCHK